MDVMASCAFSVDMDSINNHSGPLITHTSKLFRFSIPLYLFQGTSVLFYDTFFSLYGCKQLYLVTKIIIVNPFFLSGCFPLFLPLLELLGVSLFPKASTNFFMTLLEKIRAERNGGSHQVWTKHTTRGGQYR